MQTYFSYANTAERGITGSNRLMRHNFNLRATTGLFRDRIKLDGNISFMRQVVKDKPVPGGFYMNPLVGLYRFPRGVDMTPYREHFEVYDPDRKLGVQNWIAPSDDFEQNPYWITNRIRSKSLRNRVMASLSADWKVNGWLRLKARGNVDYVIISTTRSARGSTPRRLRRWPGITAATSKAVIRRPFSTARRWPSSTGGSRPTGRSARRSASP